MPCETELTVFSPLYRLALGAEWEQLPDAVKLLHQANVHAIGEFRVMNGNGRVSALFARLLRLPRSSNNAIVRLWVEAEPGGERWIRKFDSHRLITFQEPGALGEILETVGILQLRFRLTADARGIYYTECGCTIGVGRIRIAIPKGISPSVKASETVEEHGVIRVKVYVRAPVVGKLLEYEGTIKPEGGEACT